MSIYGASRPLLWWVPTAAQCMILPSNVRLRRRVPIVFIGAVIRVAKYARNTVTVEGGLPNGIDSFFATPGELLEATANRGPARFVAHFAKTPTNQLRRRAAATQSQRWRREVRLRLLNVRAPKAHEAIKAGAGICVR
ncbi:MAG: hypothetical protein C5B58_00880 [Acidobacteria bacterium]|nr:MAG: hypothetical protein C5B58_00880 [Acidobacteriota bacterium]